MSVRMLQLTLRGFALALAAALTLAALPAVHAQERYPSRPIRMIVPFTAGTGIDILARVIGQKLSERLKVPVVVENRAGASGNIGTEAVAKSNTAAKRQRADRCILCSLSFICVRNPVGTSVAGRTRPIM